MIYSFQLTFGYNTHCNNCRYWGIVWAELYRPFTWHNQQHQSTDEYIFVVASSKMLHMKMMVKSCFNWLQWLQSVSATELRVLVMRLNTFLPTVIDPSYVVVAMSLTVTSSFPPISATSRKNIIDTVAQDKHLHVQPVYRYNIVQSVTCWNTLPVSADNVESAFNKKG